jgi:hypothetical protein
MTLSIAPFNMMTLGKKLIANTETNDTQRNGCVIMLSVIYAERYK